MQTIKKGIIVILLILPILALSKSVLDSLQNNQFYDSSKAQYDKQAEINKKLKSDIAKSKDYYEVEKTVRNKLGRLKPNETELIIPRAPIVPSPTPTIIVPVYEQWKEVFF